MLFTQPEVRGVPPCWYPHRGQVGECAQGDSGKGVSGGVPLNYYERHIGDYLKDTAHLSLLEHGVYTRLLDVYYTRECGLDSGDIARLIGARSPAEKSALNVVLSEFFILTGGIYVQDRCAREIERFQDKQRKAKASADARWSHSNRNANASPPHSEGNAPQSPVPSLQSPSTSVRDAHTLPDEYREALKSRPELDPSEVYRKFCGHYPDKRRTLTVWENWVRNEHAPAGSNAADPDSQQSIEALGMSLGMGKWDQAKEQFSLYKARVRAGKVAA